MVFAHRSRTEGNGLATALRVGSDERTQSRSGKSEEKCKSTKTRALRELRELEEWNRLEELEEENQRKILELERRRIARKKKVIEKRSELRMIIEVEEKVGDFVLNEEDFPDLDAAEAGVERWRPEEKLPGNVRPFEQRSNTRPPKLQPSTMLSSKDRCPREIPVVPNVRLARPTFENEVNLRYSFRDDVSVDERDSGLHQAEAGPSRLQIASRQVFPRRLPRFSGAAEDWPMFISAYDQANVSCGFTNAENLERLQEALEGKALDTVRNRLLLPENVPSIMEKLKKRFGNPEVLSTRLAKRVQQLEGPKVESLESVIEFGSAVEEFTQHLKAAGLTDHLKNPILMQSLVQKLPSYYAMEWVDYKRRVHTVDLETFGDFMECLVEKALEATFDKAELSECSRKREKSRTKAFVNSTNAKPRQLVEKKSQNVQTRNMNCCVCHKAGHFGRNCQELLRQTVGERWQTVKRLNLCPLCLYDHGDRSCRIRMQCKVDGCQEKHNALLHGRSGGLSRVQAQCNSHLRSERAVLFRIVPVTLYNGKRRVSAIAFIDEGSSITMVDNELAEALGADGPVEPLQMSWTNGVQRTEHQSKKVLLAISARNSLNRYELLEAHTVHRLDLPAQKLDARKLVQEFAHLEHIDIDPYEKAAPKILLGIDNLHLIAPLDSRVGKPGEPVAVLCKLGWTVYGPRTNVVGNVHFLGHHRCACEECSQADKRLDDAIKQHYQLEEVGVSPIRLESKGPKEDRRARGILEKTTRRVGQRFETGLLWKEDEIHFPDSFNMAMKRMRSLEGRMNRNPGVREALQKQLNDYLVKGYAHRITERELRETPRNQEWYLPLNYVVHPKKPGKVRLVWDAAARVQGVSLNDKLRKGPDMVAALSAVINSFRERRIAFGGDIREMFHQVLVRPEDRQAQRFLFPGPNGEVEIFVMDVVIFGSNCSPCSSQFVKNLNAQEHAGEFPEAADAIIRKHYVDDYFDSADTEAEAVRRATDVRHLHARGGFEIRNWVSNSKEVLRQLGEADSIVKALEVDKGSQTERILGVLWDPEEDAFSFSTEIRDDLQPYVREGAWPTKRIALRCIASMFDPKQFLAPLLIHGRIIMQDLWRSGIGWDERLKEEHYKRWQQWTKLFYLIDGIRVPRCYLGGLDSKNRGVQLHVFTDAGDAAYGCVAYFIFDYGEVIHCAFVEAKAKVVPLQYLSTPRKELEAAVLGARLVNSICENHFFPVKRRFLWCDSDTVVSWIKSDQRRYKPFVAHRIGEIVSITNPEEWHWVGTKCNPADDLTKWGKGTEIKSESRWYRGPDFLYRGEEEWPKQDRLRVEVAEELRASVLLHHILLPDSLIERMCHISRWPVMVRTVATVFRFISNCRRRVQKKPIEALWGSSKRSGVRGFPSVEVPLQQKEYLAAENLLWKAVQADQFADEVKTLWRNKELPSSQAIPLERSSALYRLAPFLDEDGVIRMEGRTEAAEYAPFDVRFPIVLPRDHAVTTRLLEHYHREHGHSSRESVVNEVRQRFYIPRLRVQIDKVMRACTWCSIRKAKPSVPRMAPLPRQRLAARVDPFAYVGIDYFGPLEVSIGRRMEKRWVALFTCMTTRAVHLEVAYSLTTESCKMAIRRFVKRRGSPSEIFSDNVTNFVGANRDLMKELNAGCGDTFTSAKTRWTFNPSSAPHMGGAWERMVRSVKEAKKAFIDGRKLTDEILHTVLIEAENLVNSRPLTYVSTNVKEDQEALTPNHFLRGRPIAECLPPRNSVELADTLRSSYNRAQFLAHKFWDRWQKEYLPTLNSRSKWMVDQRPVAVGDLVFVADGEKRNVWERGMVKEVFTGSDGRIRSASVQTSKGEKVRPVAKLAILELNCEE
ncbi:uncharacterized protein LOC134222243 [Armigeres subalbatus]|uniref:uncharacterized protein LOC134222243 n=1 Tax=Armigeres subalbatus TaxID=124917 RepID=UPI002ED244FC